MAAIIKNVWFESNKFKGTLMQVWKPPYMFVLM